MRAGDAGSEEQDELFELTQSLAEIGVWTFDADTQALTCSAELARIVGRTVDELEQMAVTSRSSIVHPDDRTRIQEQAAAVLGGEQVDPWELRMVRPDGEVRWVEARARLVRPGHLVGVVQDITARISVQHQLETLQARTEVAQEIAHVASIEMNFHDGTVAWSPEMYRITGRDPATFDPDTEAFDVVHPDDVAGAVENVEAIASGRGGRPIDFRVIRPDGTVRWIRSHGHLVGDGQLIGYVQDVTEHHELDDDRRLHTRILELMRESVAVVGGEPSRYLYVNPCYAESLGATADEVLATAPDTFLDDAELVAEIHDAVVRDGRWEGDVTARRPDGSSMISHMTLTQVDLPERGRVNLVVSSDVTELRRQERELRRIEERQRLILEHSPIGMGVMSLTGEWLDANAALCAIVGRDLDELRHLALADVTHPDDIADDHELLRDLRAGGIDSYQREKRYVHPDGRIVWGLVTVFLLRDPDGEPYCFVGQVIDTTERKAAELQLRRSTEQLQEANEAKTNFLSRMSHELRTPLNAVLGFGQLLTFADLADEDRDSVDQILNAGGHLLALIDEVLDITSVEAGSLRLELEPVDVPAVVTEVVHLVQPMAATYDVTFAPWTASPESPDSPSSDRADGATVYADRRRIAQILLNLLSNAIKYNRPGGTVTVRWSEDGDRLRIAVTDTGRGVAADALPRVFEPFDRLGADRFGIEGTGIGLSLARSLAERMGGTLTVESVADEGSTFTLDLPVAPPIDVGPNDDEPNDDEPNDDEPMGSLGPDRSPPPGRTVAAPARRTPRRCRVGATRTGSDRGGDR